MTTRHHRGACLCPDARGERIAWELRITQRCLVDDLGLSARESFESAAREPIVGAFAKRRAEVAEPGESVGPAAGERSLYKLRFTHDHRGATWYDRQLAVVWLVAYRLHRSRNEDDFYKWIQPLIRNGSVYPVEADRQRAREERLLRFRDLASQDASALAASSRAIGSVAEGRLAWEVPVRVLAEDERTTVAFPAVLGARHRDVISAFDPKGAMSPEWPDQQTLPGQPARPGELVFELFTGSSAEQAPSMEG